MTWTELCTRSHGDILAWARDQPWSLAMAECQQDEGWHSEGDVWTHTNMVFHQLPLLEDWSGLTPHEETVLFVPFEGHRCTVTLMAGLPGTGKDAWLAANRPDLPFSFPLTTFEASSVSRRRLTRARSFRSPENDAGNTYDRAIPSRSMPLTSCGRPDAGGLISSPTTTPASRWFTSNRR